MLLSETKREQYTNKIIINIQKDKSYNKRNILLIDLEINQWSWFIKQR